jgi:hypothetical protein
MSGVTLNVSPEVLRQTADGINGVISNLSGGGLDSYSSQLGRGFGDLALTGEQISHPSAKTAMDSFVERWEWGTRALITVANEIGRALDFGAGMYELQEDYFNDAAKDMANDLVGDPSLPKETILNPDGSVAVLGTDDMSWGEVAEYNANRLSHPDWSAESFNDALPTVQQNWDSIVENAPQAGMNITSPSHAAQSTVEGFMEPDQPSAPSPGGPAPAHEPAAD